MPSKLSLHLQAHPNWADGSGSAARWIKVMDPPGENRWPGKQIIGRVYMPDNDSNALVAQGVAGAEAWFRFCQPAFARACCAAALGRKEEAVELLRDALAQGFPAIHGQIQ